MSSRQTLHATAGGCAVVKWLVSFVIVPVVVRPSAGEGVAGWMHPGVWVARLALRGAVGRWHGEIGSLACAKAVHARGVWLSFPTGGGGCARQGPRLGPACREPKLWFPHRGEYFGSRARLRPTVYGYQK